MIIVIIRYTLKTKIKD